MQNAYFKGQRVRCAFGFANRALTTAEQATFASGGGLPAGAAFDPTVVQFDYLPPGGVVTTYVYPTNAQLVKDGVGLYHVDLLGSSVGLWNWRGYDTQPGSEASTEGQFFVEAGF